MRLLGESEQERARREILLTEWRDIRASLRTLGSRRLVQITVYIVANALFLNALYTAQRTLGREAAGIIGLIVAALFLALEVDCRRWASRLVERGRRVEQQLVHLELIRYYRPASDVARWAAHALYLLCAIGWAYIGWWPWI
jgi:hypothetical protein